MYIVYKTTNQITKKYYIGMHKTNNIYDSYLGSGKVLLEDMIHYGRVNFTKDILFVSKSKADVIAKEMELINLDDPLTYNIHPGGHGGFEYINNSGIKKFHGKTHSRSSIEQRTKSRYENDGYRHNEETKKKIGEKSKLHNTSEHMRELAFKRWTRR